MNSQVPHVPHNRGSHSNLIADISDHVLHQTINVILMFEEVHKRGMMMMPCSPMILHWYLKEDMSVCRGCTWYREAWWAAAGG